ncbi:hypothetical protein N781_09115 [Pontibacillus halophilus JSM 076056 = DSM 19796]|uniref:General stress protein n=1 Tax=Pontibacillus halophilus JSM 076056 = DSM 19796 TaxID=1385510 RepID=A0A0A5GE40_9BACI|nr:bacillithiol system redox-active protein YtxJ [Pontibacillus halophilus]KGX89400.1 hypothetical protein N781_09115 [Pontibacillus halophilus JSM 076056 = DSM 19796]
MSAETIATYEEFRKVLEENEEFYVLKHSVTCPISAQAKTKYMDFAEESNRPTYIVEIQHARPLSDKIAEVFGVKHESPQALFIKNEEVKWNTSHMRITKDALKEAAEQ